MSIKIPPVPQNLPQDLRLFLQAVNTVLYDMDKFSIHVHKAAGQLILIAPNGSTYTVKVTDAGALTTTLTSGPTP